VLHSPLGTHTNFHYTLPLQHPSAMSEILPNSQDSLSDSLLKASLGPNDSISTVATTQTFGFYNTVISRNNRRRDEFVLVTADSDGAHERLKDNPVILQLDPVDI